MIQNCLDFLSELDIKDLCYKTCTTSVCYHYAFIVVDKRVTRQCLVDTKCMCHT